MGDFVEEKRTTVKDIAARLNISLSTVNKALTGKPGISEKRRAEVLSTAKEMGYVVNHVAQSLSRKPVRMGVIIPSVWKQYFDLVECGIKIQFEKLAQENVQGFFRYIQNGSDIQGALEFFYEKNIDIIIYCPSLIEVPEKVGLDLRRRNIPVFVVGDECREIDSVCSVVINTELSGRMAADFLRLFLNEGDRVAVFTGSMGIGAHAEKAEAFGSRARELSLVSAGIYETFDDRETAKACVAEMLAGFPDVKGIYVATAIAAAVTEYFEERPDIARPYIIATDIYEDIRREMANGRIAAAIYQNQVLLGRLAIKMAYRYLVGITSYNALEEEFSRKICVNPHLFLPSNVENLIHDNGNDYTLA